MATSRRVWITGRHLELTIDGRMLPARYNITSQTTNLLSLSYDANTRVEQMVG